jgi:hypothetical protein
MVYQEEKFPNNVYLTEENQAQSTPQSIYPDISDSQWGIDTLEFWAYVAPDDYQINPEWRETVKTSKKGNKYSVFRRTYDYKGQKVSISIDTGKTKCFFSLNAAKLVHADPVSLLDPDLLSSEIFLFLEAIKTEISPSEIWDKSKLSKPMYTNWQENVRISRIDVARNFYLPDSSFRSVLENMKHFGSARHITTKSRQDGWSVTNQTIGEGKDTLYNKSAQLRVKKITIQDGIYRFESQLKRGRKNKAKLKNLASVNRLSVWAALKHRWNATKWGKQHMFHSIDWVIHKLFGKKASAIVGYLRLTELGITPILTPKTVKNYKESIELALLDASLALDESKIYHLDLFAGRKVISFETPKKKEAPVNSDENSE